MSLNDALSKEAVLPEDRGQHTPGHGEALKHAGQAQAVTPGVDYVSFSTADALQAGSQATSLSETVQQEKLVPDDGLGTPVQLPQTQ